jgi:hypothetical protein
MRSPFSIVPSARRVRQSAVGWPPQHGECRSAPSRPPLPLPVRRRLVRRPGAALGTCAAWPAARAAFPRRVRPHTAAASAAMAIEGLFLRRWRATYPWPSRPVPPEQAYRVLRNRLPRGLLATTPDSCRGPVRQSGRTPKCHDEPGRGSVIRARPSERGCHLTPAAAGTRISHGEPRSLATRALSSRRRQPDGPHLGRTAMSYELGYAFLLLCRAVADG